MARPALPSYVPPMPVPAKIVYEHTQAGVLICVSLGIAILGMGVICWATPEGLAVTLAVLIVLVIALLLFCSLSVKVTEADVSLAFGIGVIRKRFALDEVAEAEIVRNRWYYGWGIKILRDGWLYNVSGLDAVELRFENGRRARIGTDQAVELLAAIESQLGSR